MTNDSDKVSTAAILFPIESFPSKNKAHVKRPRILSRLAKKYREASFHSRSQTAQSENYSVVAIASRELFVREYAKTQRAPRPEPRGLDGMVGGLFWRVGDDPPAGATVVPRFPSRVPAPCGASDTPGWAARFASACGPRAKASFTCTSAASGAIPCRTSCVSTATATARRSRPAEA